MPKKISSHPIRYEKSDWEMIQELVARIHPSISAAEIQRRAVRLFVPKMLTGEIPVTDGYTLLSARTAKRLKKSAMPA